MGNPVPERHTGVRAPSRFLRVDKAMGSEGSFSGEEAERRGEGERREERRGEGVGTRECVQDY